MNARVTSSSLGDSAYVVEVAGEVDLHNAPELKHELVSVIDNGARYVVVDLTETTFIDSTTLGVLLGGLKRLRPAGGSLLLVCGDTSLRKIFEITLLDRVFTILATREGAVAELHRLRADSA